jgi:hypothetical protein
MIVSNLLDVLADRSDDRGRGYSHDVSVGNVAEGLACLFSERRLKVTRLRLTAF